MQRLDYKGSSVNKYLVSFREMVGYAYEDGLHNNDRALSSFSKRKVEESDKAVEIYLTEAELQALAYMELKTMSVIFFSLGAIFVSASATTTTSSRRTSRQQQGYTHNPVNSAENTQGSKKPHNES